MKYLCVLLIVCGVALFMYKEVSSKVLNVSSLHEIYISQDSLLLTVADSRCLKVLINHVLNLTPVSCYLCLDN